MPTDSKTQALVIRKRAHQSAQTEAQLFREKQAMEAFMYFLVQEAKWLRYLILILSVFALSLASWSYGVILVAGLVGAFGYAATTYFGDKKLKTLLLTEAAMKKKRKTWRFWVLMLFDALMVVGSLMSLPTVIATITAMPLTGLPLLAVALATVVLVVVFTMFKYFSRDHEYNKVRLSELGSAKWGFAKPMTIVSGLVAGSVLFWVSQLVLSTQGLLGSVLLFSPISLGVAIGGALLVWGFMSIPTHYKWRNTLASVTYGLFSAMTPFFIAMALGLFTANLALPILIPLTIAIGLVCVAIGVFAGIQKYKYNDIDFNKDVKNQDAVLALRSTVEPKGEPAASMALEDKAECKAKKRLFSDVDETAVRSPKRQRLDGENSSKKVK